MFYFKQFVTYILDSFINFKKFKRNNKLNAYSMTNAAKYMKLVSFKRGDCLFKQGDQSNLFYGVISGQIDIIRTSTETIVNRGLKGRKNTVKTIEHHKKVMDRVEGECFGEWAIIFNSARTASAVAAEDSVLFELSKDHFMVTLGVF